ncbi:MAG: hypothetical protein GY942_08635, partial [Aestuariibacter sp.]|nr:hypothetical protein [Aestuariibacter sp.]
EEIQHQQSPDFAAPFALQWTDRTALLFPLTNMVLYGMGLTAGIAAWLGFFWALWRIIRGHPEWTAHAIPVAWAGVYFLFMGTRWVMSIRYFLPIYPMLFLLAGWALFELWEQAKQSAKLRPLKMATAVILMAAVALPSIFWANTFITTYTEPFTRIAASEWMFDNIPSGATLIYEVDGQEKTVHLPLKQFTFATGSNPLRLTSVMPEDGVITAVRLNYLAALPENASPQESAFTMTLDSNGTLLEGEQAVTLTHERQAVTFELAETAVTADTVQTFTFNITSTAPVYAGTSLLMTEAWDDLLPVGIDGRNSFGSYYTEVFNSQRPVTDTDSTEKRQNMVEWLEEANYIVLSSQRAMWHQPRLPVSFPMMIRYYDSLFSGELGFELVSQFHADFHIGPLYISDTTGQVKWGELPTVGWPPPGDLAAEEAFSIYDHPPVWIFEKTDAYSRDNTLQILGSVDLSPDKVQFMTPGQATESPNALMLRADELAVQQANGTFSEIFNLEGALS